MNIIIQSTLNTLQKSKSILANLADEDLCNTTVSPYHSSIGSHIRHILDFYECVLSIDSENRVDLTARSRNKAIEIHCQEALQYLNLIIEKLKSVEYKVDDLDIVIDDLGLGKVEIQYTFGALVAQANSHTIHHYAIINYIFDRLGIVLKDKDFGYNPTTPKAETLN